MSCSTSGGDPEGQSGSPNCQAVARRTDASANGTIATTSPVTTATVPSDTVTRAQTSRYPHFPRICAVPIDTPLLRLEPERLLAAPVWAAGARRADEPTRKSSVPGPGGPAIPG